MTTRNLLNNAVEKDNKKLNKHKPSKPEVKTTGHEWDGIQENDLPDPLWLRWSFYITLFFSLGYWFFYPSWPSQNSDGILKWTSIGQLQESLEEIEEIRSKYLGEFDKASFQEISENEELLTFALRGGNIAFANNCAMCHGAGGNGNKGYPNLTAGAWIWGGKVEDIYQTLLYGIRSGHDEARDSQMAAFGKDGILTETEINTVTDFTMGLRDGKTTGKGSDIYVTHCAACHGAEGQGGRDFGAPALNDAVWLYGGDRETIYDVIYNGRQGVMPYWNGKLSDATIRQLAVYVHQLGGGE
ncbi:UNVERIFIED_CONTAM: hypothetical protein GTU68_010034 [Idotea baltica]|nr:hypothetical protein [Idotea baltica]